MKNNQTRFLLLSLLLAKSLFGMDLNRSLIEAITLNRPQFVIQALNAKADVNTPCGVFNYSIETIALTKAILEDKFEIVKILLENKADANFGLTLKHSSIHKCISLEGGIVTPFMHSNPEDCDSFKLEKLAARYSLRTARPLHLAISKVIDQENIDLVSLLIKHKASVDSDGQHEPPLSYAVGYNRTSSLKILKLLLDCGADYNNAEISYEITQVLKRFDSDHLVKARVDILIDHTQKLIGNCASVVSENIKVPMAVAKIIASYLHALSRDITKE